MDITALTLFGRARYQVLACLYGLRQDEGLHLREIARRTGLSPTAVQYELRLLTEVGLVAQDDRGSRQLYRAELTHSIAKELRAILRKTSASAGAGKVAGRADAAHWAAKRAQQEQDYASPSLTQKSPFLANRKATRAFNVDFSPAR